MSGSNITVTQNLIQDNTAQKSMIDATSSGGGIYIAGEATFINNIVTNNRVEGNGGQGAGIFISGSAPELYHTTLANNTGGDGSGIYVSENYGGDPAQPLLYNTIIVSQTVGVKVSDGSPQNLATLDGVLWWNNGTNTEGAAFVFHDTTGDPAFVDPANDDYHIGSASAAIDAGIDAGVTVDYDHEPRFGDPDLGADEYWAPGVLRRIYLPLIIR